MKNQKLNRGITLIALVITIVILLILSGITLSMITGENGILNRTGEAKRKTEEGALKEKNQLSDFRYLIEELFYNTNATTAIMVGEARGMALLACAKAGIKISEYTPPEIKSSLTGYGRADKNQVQTMVKTILGLAETPKPDDTADAIAAAICHAHHAGNKIPR